MASAEKHHCFASLTKACVQPELAKELNCRTDTQVGRLGEIETYRNMYYSLQNRLPNTPPNHSIPTRASWS